MTLVPSDHVVGSETELVEHVERLMRRHRLKVRYICGHWAEASGNAVLRDIVGPPITNVETYAVWLHEIGHTVLGHVCHLDDHDATQQQEAEAWRWAFKRSRVGRDRRVLFVAGVALQTYAVNEFGYQFSTPNPKWKRLMNELRNQLGVTNLPPPWRVEF